MNNNGDIFDNKYARKSGTTIEKGLTEEETKTMLKIEDETKTMLKIEDEKYGISKPIRVIIKARVTHGKDISR